MEIEHQEDCETMARRERLKSVVSLTPVCDRFFLPLGFKRVQSIIAVEFTKGRGAFLVSVIVQLLNNVLFISYGCHSRKMSISNEKQVPGLYRKYVKQKWTDSANAHKRLLTALPLPNEPRIKGIK